MRLFTFILVLLVPSLGASEQINVFACEPEWAHLTQRIGGNRVDVFTATSAQQDPHHIEARPSLIAKMRNTDLVVCTGADLEVGWLPLLIRRSGNRNVLPGNPGYFEAALMVERLDIPDSLDRADGDVHAAGNPHVHLDPHRMLTIAEALQQRLIALDAAGKTVYQTNFTKFQNTWNDSIKTWEEKAQSLRGMPIVAYHQNWTYLNEWLGLTQLATIESKPGIPPSATDQKRLLDSLQNTRPKAILIANYQSDKAARWLSQHLNVPTITLPSTVGGTAGAQSLEAFYDYLVTAIETANNDAL